MDRFRSLGALPRRRKENHGAPAVGFHGALPHTGKPQTQKSHMAGMPCGFLEAVRRLSLTVAYKSALTVRCSVTLGVISHCVNFHFVKVGEGIEVGIDLKEALLDGARVSAGDRTLAIVGAVQGFKV